MELLQNVKSLLQIINQRNADIELLKKTNHFVFELDNEVPIIFKRLKDLYNKRFPELESLNLNPFDYSKVVQQIGGAEELSKVNYSGVLSSSVTLVLSMATTNSQGQRLTDEKLAEALKLAQAILEIQSYRIELLKFIENQMDVIAPNVTAIVGSSIASQLIGVAGGIRELANIPAGNIQVLGSSRKDLSGMSMATSNPHAGIIFNCDLVEQTPSEYKVKAQRLVAAKVCLAARVDVQKSATNEFGKNCRLEIVKKLEKLYEPVDGKLEKPIPPPILESKKKRGGRRARQQKQLISQTKARKLQNRLAFGEAEHEVVVGSSVVGMGMLSGNSSSAMRLPPMDSKARDAAIKQGKKVTKGFFSDEIQIRNPFSNAASITIPMAPGSNASNPTPPKEPSTGSKYFNQSKSFRKNTN